MDPHMETYQLLSAMEPLLESSSYMYICRVLYSSLPSGSYAGSGTSLRNQVLCIGTSRLY